jgi:hypothetical protein
VEPDFALARLTRNSKGLLEMMPNLSNPGNTFGFWSSESFTLKKPADKNDANMATAYVEYSYSAVQSGHKRPTIRVRLNRTDYQESALYLYDGRNFSSNGGSGEITCKFDTNALDADQSYILSVDFISLDEPADPNFTITISDAYIVRYEEIPPSDFIIDGVWMEDDEDAKAWINGYLVKLAEYCYDASYNDEIAAVIAIVNEYWREYDVYVWADDDLFWLNESDTFQVAVAGQFAVYLEQDGDVKAWNPFTDELLKLVSDGFRISSGGDEALMIWDMDDNLYVWIPGDGLYKVDENDIWYLCDTTTVPIQ